MQRRVAVFVSGIYLGPAGQQQFRHVLMALLGRPVQRRSVIIVFVENEVRIALEERLYLFQVTSVGRLSDPGFGIATGGDKANQSNHNENDGATPRSCGERESIRERIHSVHTSCK